jgi:hypothetical protein
VLWSFRTHGDSDATRKALAQARAAGGPGDPERCPAPDREVIGGRLALLEEYLQHLAPPRPAKYADIVPALADASIIRLETAARLESLAGYLRTLEPERGGRD